MIFAEINVGNRLAIEFQGRIARQIVSDDHRARHGRDVEQFAGRFGQILVAHRAVRGAEIDSLCEDLLLPATRADRLIVKPDGGIDFRISVEPF